MPILYDVEHVTTYSYAAPVTFGAHRAMFLPRSGPYGRILSYSATTNLASRVRWIIDALSNVVTLIDIDEPGAELSFTFRLRGIHYGVAEAEAFPVEARAEEVPVQYTPDEWQDLAGYLRPHAEDADGSVASWAKSFLAKHPHHATNVIRRMLDTIGTAFSYQAREAEGTQSPGQTLQSKSGHRIHLRWLTRLRRRSGRDGIGGDACLGPGLPAGRRLAALRPDQPHHRRHRPDPSRHRPPSGTGGPPARIVVRQRRRFSRHVRESRHPKVEDAIRGRRGAGLARRRGERAQSTWMPSGGSTRR